MNRSSATPQPVMDHDEEWEQYDAYDPLAEDEGEDTNVEDSYAR